MTEEEYQERIKELRAEIDRLSNPGTRFKELLNQHIAGTDFLHHKVDLTELNTANRDYSAGYVKALQDLMRLIEAIDYDID